MGHSDRGMVRAPGLSLPTITPESPPEKATLARSPSRPGRLALETSDGPIVYWATVHEAALSIESAAKPGGTAMNMIAPGAEYAPGALLYLE